MRTKDNYKAMHSWIHEFPLPRPT